MRKHRITRHTRLQHKIAPGSVRPPRTRPPTPLEVRAARRAARPPLPRSALESIWSSALSALIKPKTEDNDGRGPRNERRGRRNNRKGQAGTGHDQPARRGNASASRQGQVTTASKRGSV